MSIENIKLTHITFAVQNMEESLLFYKKWLGLEIHRDRRPKGNTVWLVTQSQVSVEVPDFVFVLHEGAVSKVDHFGFQVDRVEQIYEVAKLAKKENILVGGPEELGGVLGTYVLIKDPNGHIWEFTHGQPIRGI